MLETLARPVLDETYEFPSIEPLQDEASRPFWSVMIPTYNGTQYLAQTLESVLQQDPGADMMQIEVVDDCSTKDDPEALVKEIGQGRVLFYRNPQNLGLLANWDSCINRARGQWVHLLHQDDYVLSDFYASLKKGILQEPTIGALLTRHIFIDGEGDWQALSELEQRNPGVLIDWLEKIATIQRVQFPAIVVKRSTYEKLGGFCNQVRSAADWEMWKRIAANYPIWYEPKLLACFRLHSSSTTSSLIKRGENISDTYRAIDISRSYLPDAIANRVSKKAKIGYAFKALTTARQMLARNEIDAAIAQLKQGFKCYENLDVLKSAILVSFLVIKKWLVLKIKPVPSSQQ